MSLPNAQPRPERRSALKKRTTRQRHLSRAQCRAIVFRRDQGRCQGCRRLVTDDCWAWEPQRAHVHEIVPRSLGGSSTDPKNCQLLCARCHLPNGVHRAGART